MIFRECSITMEKFDTPQMVIILYETGISYLQAMRIACLVPQTSLVGTMIDQRTIARLHYDEFQ